MNYYERVQQSINFIENNLHGPLELADAAREACMSMANYYRLFFALTGYSVKEYIRLRRISIACEELKDMDKSMADIAMDAQFGTQESFIKVFKKIVGITPGRFRLEPFDFIFKRRDIMEEYFTVQDKALLDKYPDIKVLKKLPPTKVAYYCHRSRHPEMTAWGTIQEWVQKNNLDDGNHKLRYFGFDNPPPSQEGMEYGYESWVTIDDSVEVRDEHVKEKYFEGGLFAVTSTTVKEVFQTWMRMAEWLSFSKYQIREGIPCLEEVILFGEEEEKTKLDIYMPIEEREIPVFEITELPDCDLASIKKFGKDAQQQVTAVFRDFLKKYGTPDPAGNFTFYFCYNHKNRWNPDNSFWFELLTPHNVVSDRADNEMTINKQEAGLYAVLTATAQSGIGAWQGLVKAIEISNEYEQAEGPWYEKFTIDREFKNANINMKMKCLIKIAKKKK